MAPLKKRRVVRQCSDLNAEDMPSPKEDIKDLAIEDGELLVISLFGAICAFAIANIDVHRRSLF